MLLQISSSGANKDTMFIKKSDLTCSFSIFSVLESLSLSTANKIFNYKETKPIPNFYSFPEVYLIEYLLVFKFKYPVQTIIGGDVKS